MSRELNRNYFSMSKSNAEVMGQMIRWWESRYANIDCASYMNNSYVGIESEHDGKRLNKDCAKKFIEWFGLQRVEKVVAFSICRKLNDGRISNDIKEWAKMQFEDYEKVALKDCVINCHAGLIDLVAKQILKYREELKLFDRSHCGEGKDYEGKILVLRDSVLKNEHIAPENQLWLATGGFGCDPDKIGTTIYATSLYDGQKENWKRYDFHGIIKEECMPDWAKEGLKKIKEKQKDNGDR